MLPEDRLYTKTHEWAMEQNGKILVGLTAHAAEALGDIVFVELPPLGKKVGSGEATAVVESVKAASDIFAPLSGEVAQVNDTLADAPESLNHDPWGTWIFALAPEDKKELSSLLDARGYAELLAKET